LVIRMESGHQSDEIKRNLRLLGDW